MRNQVHHIALLAWVASACGDTNNPKVRPCTATISVQVSALAVAAYTSIDAGTDGCATFAANATADTIEYLVVAQSVGTDPNRSVQFRLAGEAMIAVPPPPIMASLQSRAPPSPAEQFHYMLREAERTRTYAPRPEGAPMQLNISQPPPEVGHVRDFKVCADLRCVPPMTTVTGVAKAVGQQIALYVDITTQDAMTQVDYDSLVALFDQRLYAIDTAAFGVTSDLDNNSVVMALMTPQINRLVTTQQCVTSGFVAGYFFGADLTNDATYNRGEVLYALVPDPSGQYSCAHSVQRVKDLMPPVFIHELQHMINFNYKVLVPNAPIGRTEYLWLNEALSHYAEELGGRSYLPGDQAKFSQYLTGNVRNAYDYMSRSGDHFLVAHFGSGSLGERGAGWLFMRYLIDQTAADTTTAAWNVVTRELVQSELQGTRNVEAATGHTFEHSVARWALALWVSDLPDFTAPPELKYRSWRFRTTYGNLYPTFFPRPYPLQPEVTIGAEVNLSGTMRTGSGVYERVLHPPGAGTFTLQLADVNGAPMPAFLEARLTVIRVR